MSISRPAPTLPGVIIDHLLLDRTLSQEAFAKLPRQRQIAVVVDDVIYGGENGLEACLETVRRYAEKAMNYPQDRTALREYKRWARAVRNVINRKPLSFLDRCSDADLIRAQAFGISLC